MKKSKSGSPKNLITDALAQEIAKVPVLDIPGLSTFQDYHENPPELEMQGTRITAMFKADQRFFELAERYNRNELVNVLDFVNCQRKLKAKMLALKHGGGR